MPEYEIKLISKNTTSYDYRLSAKNYLLIEIYRAACLDFLGSLALVPNNPDYEE